MSTHWFIVHLASVDYEAALSLQRRLVPLLQSDRSGPAGVVLFLEHPRVFTLGRRGGRDHLTVGEDFLEKEAIPIVHVERGGDITYHGPGQLVGYPVVHLPRSRISVVDFVTGLESVMIRTAADMGVNAGRNDRNRGVWVGECKLGSIGIHVSRGVSMHGFALNVNVDLAPFGWMHPCGLTGVQMTSLQKERRLREPLSMETVRRRAAAHLAEVFDVGLEEIGERDIFSLWKGHLDERDTTCR